MIVVISGTRTLNDSSWVESVLNIEVARLMVAGTASLEFRVGDARGVDALAASYFGLNALDFRVYKANWDAEGRAAGALRNWEMMKGPPRADLLIVMWQNSSPGTRNAIAAAMSQDIECRVRFYPDLEPVYTGAAAIRRVVALQSAELLKNAAQEPQHG